MDIKRRLQVDLGRGGIPYIRELVYRQGLWWSRKTYPWEARQAVADKLAEAAYPYVDGSVAMHHLHRMQRTLSQTRQDVQRLTLIVKELQSTTGDRLAEAGQALYQDLTPEQQEAVRTQALQDMVSVSSKVTRGR